MEYLIIVNQPLCVKHKLNLFQGAQLEFLAKLSTWATSIIHEKEVYYNITFEKISEELPLVFSTSNKAYRCFLELKKKGLIEQIKVGRNQHNYVRLSTKGKKLLRFDKNNEPRQGSTNPSTRFDKSDEPQKTATPIVNTENVEKGSTNPSTYHNQLTNNHIYIDFSAYHFLYKNAPSEVEIWEMQNKKDIPDFEKFLEFFEIKVEEEEIEYSVKKLMGRLKRLKFSWKGSFTVIKNNEQPTIKRKRIG
ncbi:hypothetical protein [Tenacibaculum sp. nBUS_03]|uniref:hypothetical protein n=1 Tax=Tenacibaculum sp. nBUS_03 TaxID=3395320 RepID=UPI003EBD04B9